jgi:hypothetical protein
MPWISSTLDFALRLAFFVVAPGLLVRLAELYPVTGALVQIGVSLIVAHRLRRG